MDSRVGDDGGDLLTRHKLTTDDYHRMEDAGILGADDRVELIGGEIIDMAAIGVRHAFVVMQMARVLIMACGDLAMVSIQSPIRLDEANEPQPDFAVLRPQADVYKVRHPGPADVYLLVEVADTSLRFDRAVKLPLYARAGIPEVWIVDLQRQAIDVYRDPAGGSYAQPMTQRTGYTIGLSALPEVAVAVENLIG